MANFSLTGGLVTERIRDLWNSRNFKVAIDFGLTTLEGSELSHIISIIDGTMKLTGTNDLDLVDDNEYKPELSFYDILNYTMLPNSGYFRIYDEDQTKATEIINSFDLSYPDSVGDEQRQQLIRDWFVLLPEVRIDNYDKITHWMAVYMRKSSEFIEVRQRASFYSNSIVETELPIIPDRKIFDEICDRHYIYADREETWENCVKLRKRIIEPLPATLAKNIEKEFKSYRKDITMKSEYGWLSRDGRYTVCEWAAHEVLAGVMCEYFKYPFTNEQKIGRQLSDVLLGIGYVKIHRDDIGIHHITHNKKLSPEQELKVDRYKAVHKIK